MKTNVCYLGNCLDVLPTLPDNSVDSIVTDPPYEIGFMNRSWDNSGIAYSVPMWKECLRVLKPGGHLLSFSGTRTYHRMAVAIEDAGFEVRDMIEWCYGSGFPKSLNIGKAVNKLQGNERELIGTGKSGSAETHTRAMNSITKDGKDVFGGEYKIDKGTSEWEGWGTALKPAHEPICMARKPLEAKTVAENVLKYGTGGINIDESRVEYQSEVDKASATPQGKCTSNTSAGSAPDVDMSEVDYNGEKYWYKNEYKWLIDKWLNDEDYVWSELKENLETYDWCKVPEIDNGDRVLFDSQEGVCVRLYESKRKEFERPDQLGRFPANLIHDNSEEVRECFPDTKSSKGSFKAGDYEEHETSTNFTRGDFEGRGDSGNASRFFKSIIYQAKASKSERNKGCEGLEGEKFTAGNYSQSPVCKTCNKTLNGTNDHSKCSGDVYYREMKSKATSNNHPTVKPIALMSYLIKMVTPKGGVVLDHFAGSGSTLVAAKENGFQYIGIEMTEEYLPIIEARTGCEIIKLL
jgi:DNA modification methylase